MAYVFDFLMCVMVILNVLCIVPGGLGQSVSCTFEDGMCGWTQATDDESDWFRHAIPAPLDFTGPLRDRSGPGGPWTLRLRGGSSMHEGRVEVFIYGQWGTVCDDNWDLNDANVVCRQLGYGAAISAPSHAAYGAGQGPIYLRNLRCSGQESSLSQCSHSGVGQYCSHSEDAGVQCSGTSETSGTNPSVSTAFYCFSYGGNYAGNKARLVSPEVRVSGTHGAWRLTFWYNMYGSYIGRLNVYKTPFNGTLSGSSVIFSRYTEQTSRTQWRQAEVFISDVASPGFRIVLEVVRHSSYSSGYSYRGDIAVDDIDLREYNNLAPLGFSCTFQDGYCGWTQSAQDQGDWRRNRGSTPTSSTGPNVDRTIGDSSGYYCYVRSSDLTNRQQSAVLLSPPIVRDGQDRHWCFTFWYNMYGSHMGTLNVYKIPAGGELDDGEIIFSRSGQQTGSTTWLEAEIHLTDAPSSFQIAFQAIRTYRYYYHYYNRGDIAIDDIKHNAPCSDCDFEQDTCGWTQSVEDDAQWTRHRGPTESDDTGPEFDKTTGDISGYYCYFEASSPRSHGDTAVLRSGLFPPAPDHPGLTWYIRFWYNMHGNDIGTLNVYRMPSNGTTADGEVLFSRTGEQSNGTVWLPAVVNVTHAASGFRIAFEAVRGLGYLSDIAIDDVTTSSVVLATRILLFDSSLNYSTGDVVHLVEGRRRQFSCVVPDIDPGASIKLTVRDREISGVASHRLEEDAVLTTSTRTFELSPTQTEHGEILECRANNVEDHSGVSVSVRLEVKVPPQVSSISLYDASGTMLGPTADIVHGLPHTFTCNVTDTRPAVTIEWYLNDILQHTSDSPISGDEDELVNTTSTWTFQPIWSSHVEVVRCVARTAESLEPFPSVSVTVTVYAYPLIIRLSDSSGTYTPPNGTSHLVEGVEHQFTCEVPDIDPGASITWSVGGQLYLEADSNDHVRGDNGLTTTTSIVALVPTMAMQGQMLECHASNTDDHPGVTASVQLYMKVPPKTSSMSLYDSSGARLTSTADIDQGVQQAFTCTVRDTSPAATIRWYLADVLQDTVVPAAGADQGGFVNTSDTWTLIPTRDDNGKELSCVASTAESLQPFPFVSVTLHVNVLSTSIILSGPTKNYPSVNGTSHLVEGVARNFTCMVPGVDPGASFNWTLGSRELVPVYSSNITRMDGLINSTSVVTVRATARGHGKILRCRASIKAGHPGISTGVMLDVKVPPKASSMSLYITNGTRLYDVAEVVQDTPRTLTCRIAGTRPAPTVQWFLDDVSQSLLSPPTGVDEGLVDTAVEWTFTPSRVNQGQEVKCLAYTAESNRPYPSVVVTMDVIVLPVTITLSDSSQSYTSAAADTAYLLDGESHQFTCEVPDIHPGASFIWTLGDREITGEVNTHVPLADGLTTSMSVATVTAENRYHGDILQCSASNRDGDRGFAVSVTLYVQVPPTASHMSLYDVKGDRLQTTAVVDEGTMHPFTCEVLNTRPAVTIQWYINGVLHRTTPPTTTGDRLVNSTDTWAFVPRKADHHLQELTCVASTAESQQPFPSVSVTLDVKVSPTSLTISDSNGTYPVSGGTAYLLEGAIHPFTCEALNIDPGANFTWTLGGRWIAPVNGSNVVGPGGWTNSSSVVSLAGTESNHGKVLTCLAKNRDDRPGATANVTFYVQVPPKATSVHLYDSTGTSLHATKDVDQGVEVTFMCEVRDTRPAAKIEWFLRDALQSSINPASSGETAGLVNTTATWTFTPGRADHRQVVSCRASTTESRHPFPSVNVTLDVNGPPDIPVVTGSTDMTEGVPANLTCQADQGYPADWTLLWSVRDSPVEPGPRTAPSGLSGGRFAFTSTLEFSPRREDNGNTIQCSAHKDPWSLVSGPAFGPMNIQFCSRMVTLTGCPRRVVAGGAASLRCVSGTSNPASTLRWTKGEANLTSHVRPTLADGDFGGLVTTANLTASPLDRTDHGAVIKCCASGPSACQADVCDTCLLNVEYNPFFTEPTMSTPGPVNEGDDVVLSCTADANPKPPDFITWEMVGSTDSLPSVYSNGTSTLTLRGISRDQVGPYRCRGNNGVPPVTFSKQIRVAIHYEVTITNKASGSNHIRASNGERASLVCEAKGNPLPIMTWLGPRSTRITNQTDPGRVSQVDIISGDGVDGYTVRSVLFFTRVSDAEDYGLYTCNSGNGIGMVDTLIIQLSDKVMSTAPPTEAAASTALPDRASVASTIPATVKVTTRATTAPQQAASTTGHVMTRPPAPPGHVFIDHDRSTATSLTVKWSPGNNGGSAQWFYVNYREVRAAATFHPSTRSGRLAGVTEYTLSGLRPYTVYEVEVYAENSYGASATVTKAGTTRQMSTEASVCKSCTDQTSPSSAAGIDASTPLPSNYVNGIISTAGASQAVAGSPNTVMIVVIAVLAVVALVSVAFAVWFYRKRRLHKPAIDLPPLFFNRADRLQDEGSVATEIVEFGAFDLPMGIVGSETKDDSA